jgi:hypothetical protein
VRAALAVTDEEPVGPVLIDTVLIEQRRHVAE